MDFYYSQQRAVLDEGVYSTVRSMVKSKLGTNAKNFVAGLDI